MIPGTKLSKLDWKRKVQAPPTEHPAFTKAKTLPIEIRGLFPTSVEEARTWQQTIIAHALAQHVLIVAVTRIECAWSAYAGAVPGYNHEQEKHGVAREGDKIRESVARAMFPGFNEVPYDL
jgi:hypothetical protein